MNNTACRVNEGISCSGEISHLESIDLTMKAVKTTFPLLTVVEFSPSIELEEIDNLLLHIRNAKKLRYGLIAPLLPRHKEILDPPLCNPAQQPLEFRSVRDQQFEIQENTNSEDSRYL